ncbi:Carboxyl methyltransferase [Komagataella phaffii CBS 7435]|uniref:Leucine carboxyl methyltransferase 1 n=2 Tax=Komagataella phaffii TaxID=460519 RepID=C4R2F8_KOMPG|nr:Carboxyl methyltransferase [Komagataella phaffii GS115]AOA62153.1 GQ67_01101T0 [Komagataella phaffii]CAH2447765.1 Carboxyl methyltransferase [Komagataella phaffii CBS 7435]AOA67894.1 GQ68_00288T0 [Komagataella phaffii GS115]CAY69682.1 Carboxyl methyltransferase [Komagataella phaffii GS115]CCA37942.1 Carboxyl methyltransferase [Komagataella phaffii CBS 7435]
MAIQETDYDALFSRYSATNKGYLEDEYLAELLQSLIDVSPLSAQSPHQQMNTKRKLLRMKKSIKMPIINRGTYIRTFAIDSVIESFLNSFPNEKTQVVSLGAGSDTRVFRYSNRPNLRWIECDFEQTVKLKKCAILKSTKLRNCLGIDEQLPTNNEEFKSLSSTIDTPSYLLQALDLNEFTDFRQLDIHDVPTIVLAECVFCYLPDSTCNNILSLLNTSISNCSFLIYDPMGGEQSDNFGKVMVNNLAQRNISMPNLMKYGTLDAQNVRFQALGLNLNVALATIDHVMETWLSQEELARISKLEFLDELEECKLLFKHYCLIVLYKGWKPEQSFQVKAIA